MTSLQAEPGSVAKIPWQDQMKDWDESQHPRVPAGSPDGGQFGEGGGGGSSGAGSSGALQEHTFAHAGQVVHVLNDDEITTLEDYFEDSSINSSLRKAEGRIPEKLQEEVQILDKIVGRNVLAEKTVVYRAIRDKANGLQDHLEEGNHIVDHGFQSWTTSLGTIQDVLEMDTGEVSAHSFIMRATLPKGFVALNVKGDQSEIILPRGLTLIPVGNDAKGHYVVKVRR